VRGFSVIDPTPEYLKRGPLLPLPASWGEVCLIAALAEYPAARHLAKRRRLDTDELSSVFSRQLARELIDDLPISPWVADALLHYSDAVPLSWKGALSVCLKLDDGVTNEAAALAAVSTFVHGQLSERVDEQLAWAAAAAKRGELTPRGRAELAGVLDKLDAVEGAA
jgi:hypothetical protein